MECCDLQNPDPNEINDKLNPFFWRTNKNDLEVPQAENDIILCVKPSNIQIELAKAIYENESGILAIYISYYKLQLTQNYCKKNINYSELEC